MSGYLDPVPVTNEILKSQLDEANIRLKELDSRFSSLEKHTSDLIETFEALKGLWKVLQWLAKLVKILGSLSIFTVAIWWIKDHIKDIVK
jgi:dynactin complex subunit